MKPQPDKPGTLRCHSDVNDKALQERGSSPPLAHSHEPFFDPASPLHRACRTSKRLPQDAGTADTATCVEPHEIGRNHESWGRRPKCTIKFQYDTLRGNKRTVIQRLLDRNEIDDVSSRIEERLKIYPRRCFSLPAKARHARPTGHNASHS